MKVVIWIGCFLVATILNTILGYAIGVKAGFLLFYLAVFFVARKLCRIWDENRQRKEIEWYVSAKKTQSIIKPKDPTPFAENAEKN